MLVPDVVVEPAPSSARCWVEGGGVRPYANNAGDPFWRGGKGGSAGIFPVMGSTV